MSKSANGQGHVRQRKNGTWEGRVTLGSRTVSVYAPTQKVALAKMKTAKEAHAEGLPANHRQTVAGFLDDWLEALKPSIRPTTYASYRGIVATHLTPELGQIQLAQLTAQDVQRLVSKLGKKSAIVRASTKEGRPAPEKRPLSPRTVEYCVLVLRRALNKAVAWRLIGRNPAEFVSPPRVVRQEVRFLDPDQAKALLEAVKGTRLEAFYSVALAIGLRRSESLGLRWSDIDLVAGSLTVRNQLQRVDGRLGLTEPKTSSGRRSVALPAFAVDALKAHKARQAETRTGAGDTWKETGYVFTTQLGTPIEPSNVTRSFAKALLKAKLPKMRYHELRHTAASLMLAQGVQPRVVMEILGHSRIGLTMDTYSHVLPALTREAANVMDAVLRSGT